MHHEVARSGDAIESCTEITQVYFRQLSEREIAAYVDSKDPMDKAGSYGIQCKGVRFVKGIVGDYFNVVGLPVARLKRELLEFLP